MQETIHKLCTYVETGEIPFELRSVVKECGDQTLAGVIRLLQWLRSPFDRSLELDKNSALAGAISRIILASVDLSQLLEVGELGTHFKDTISPDEKQRIKEFVRSRPIGRLMAKNG